jgi:endonuclease/exonuclease/phosphatase family metal-dependent hydrolase
MPRLRIATFNLENLDDGPDVELPLASRIAVLRPQLLRLDADVLCLQEVDGQTRPGGGKKSPRYLDALDRLLEETPYAGYARAFTRSPRRGGPLDRHNLVILSRFPILEERQIRHELTPAIGYRMVTADPAPTRARPVEWDRPALYAALDLGGRTLHVVNLHLRAPLASFVPGQKEGPFAWSSIAGWAEGFFLASVKRTGQAFEVRLFLEKLFDADEQALIAVCGDCNAEDREMPLRVLRAESGDTGNGRLVPRSLVAVDRTVAEDRRFTVLHAGEAVMLDHVLVSRSLLSGFRQAEIHNEALSDEVVASTNSVPSAESFHAPVVAGFELPD